MKKITKKSKIFTVIIIVAIIMIGVFIYYLFDLFKYNKYSKYEEKMEVYNLAMLYNNKSPQSNQFVTAEEMLRILIAASYNKREIPNIITNTEDSKEVFEYAKNLNIISKDLIESENYNSKVSFVEVIECMSNCKINLLKKNISTDVKPEFSDYDTYSINKKYGILDMVSSNLIQNNTGKINGNRKIRKGEFNKLVVNFLEMYTIMSEEIKLVENEEDMPSNYQDYPYIVEGVDKQVYEQEFIVEDDTNSYNPSEFYKYRKQYYDSTIELCENYYNLILNMDYRTVNMDTLKTELRKYTLYSINEEELSQYIEYIKKNEIIIMGEAQVQEPGVYTDGVYCRVRMKLQFNIVNSKTKNNILYGDLNSYSNITYNKDTYDVYIDAVLGHVLGSDDVSLYERPIHTLLLKMSENEFIVELKEMVKGE